MLEVGLFGGYLIVLKSAEHDFLILDDAELIVFENCEFVVEVGHEVDLLGGDLDKVDPQLVWGDLNVEGLSVRVFDLGLMEVDFFILADYAVVEVSTPLLGKLAIRPL